MGREWEWEWETETGNEREDGGETNELTLTERTTTCIVEA